MSIHLLSSVNKTTMQSKLFYTYMIVVALIATSIIYFLFDYQIDQYIAEIAAAQLEDDSSYSFLKSQSSLHDIVSLTYYILTAILLFLVVKVWRK